MDSFTHDPIDLHLAQRILKYDPSPTPLKEEALAKFFANMREGALYLSLDKCPDLKVLESPLVQDILDIETIPTLPFVRWNQLLYLQRHWMLEKKVFHHLERILSFKLTPITSSIDETKLDEEQRLAIKNVHNNPLTIITGGPGTGKTYTISFLVKTFPESSRIALTAFTAKAVKKLSEGIPGAASLTLHSLLKLRNIQEPIEEGHYLPYDLIIIDECSMIDGALWLKILSSISYSTRLVLLGDPMQLPPIGSDGFFSHFCTLPCTISLKGVKRAEGLLQKLSEATLREDAEEFFKLSTFFEGKDLLSALKEIFTFGFTSPPTPEELLEKLKTFRVLSCVRRGVRGIDHLNRDLADHFRSKRWPIPLMITRNDYRLQLSNGQTGIQNSSETALFEDDEKQMRTFPIALLPPYEYGYALSVHKAQGSEYDHLFLIIPENSEGLSKELLYTGITRAKKNITLVGNKDSVKEMMSHPSRKNSGLLMWLIKQRLEKRND